jgi:pimeloyl-ACP methyl ester carboxylesterase
VLPALERRHEVLGNRGPAAALARCRRPLPDGWLPNADWVELDGVGHSPQLDVPAETAELILGVTEPVS